MIQGTQTRIGTREKNNKNDNNKGTRLDFKGTQGRMDLVPLWHSGQVLGLLGSLRFECCGKMTSWDLSLCSGRVLWDVTKRPTTPPLFT